jgi:NosR/NirI family nitrous oxide reductase transcriptional regulator
MTGTVRGLILLGVLLGPAACASAQEMLSRPEIPGYKTPDWQSAQQRAQPEATLREYLDVAVLAGGLALASYLALVRRSRTGLFLLAIASLAWLGFWRKGCVCPIGAIQNVALALSDPDYLLPASVLAIFVLPLGFSLFFGRTFCAAVCPLGAIQELVAVRPVKVPAWLEHALGLLAYVYLGAAVLFAATGTAFVICEYDPFVGFFRLSASASMLLLGGCFLLVGVFVGRPYCRFLCPYGAILGLLSKVSKWHARIPPQECINCRLCEDACPYGAIREPTVPQTSARRALGRRRLLVVLMAVPVLVLAGTALGRFMDAPLAWVHPTTRLAERVRLEEISRESGLDVGTTDASDAFRNTGRPSRDLYAEALWLRGRFGWAGMFFGGWVGLVIGTKLVHLSIRRRREDFQPDRASCVSCGRCYWYCPLEQVRRGWIGEEEIIDVHKSNATTAI